jgi:AraC-like DNA-binding protein
MLLTRTLQSFVHAPTRLANHVFYIVLRASHIRTAPEHKVKREADSGHEWIYCRRGEGRVFTANRWHTVTPGSIAWISTKQPHAHESDSKNPWEILSLRLDGRDLDRLASQLDVCRNPVFPIPHPAGVVAAFARVFKSLKAQPRSLDALLHAEIAGLLAQLFAARNDETQSGMDEKIVPKNLRKPLESIRVYYQRHWLVGDLARQAGMSEPQFYRTFRKIFHVSPIEMLRSERLHQAMRRLEQTEDSVAYIAEQVGYGDPFYFSKDFHRAAGLPPSHYRARLKSGQPVT